MPTASKVAKPQSRAEAVFAVIFFGIFTILGLTGFYFLTVRPLMKINTARSWTITSCTMIDSEVETHSGSDGSTFSIAITYRYDYGGREYTGDRYNFSSGSSSGYHAKAEVVENYPPGSTSICYVNPADPSEAVLNREFGNYTLVGLITLLFAVVGIGGMIVFFVIRRNSRRRQHVPHAGTKRAVRSTVQTPQQNSATLGVRTGRGCKIAGVLIFAIIWSGVIAYPIFGIVIPDILQNQVDKGLSLVMIPFALVGIGAIGAVIYQFLAASNPKPILTLSATTLVPGFTGSLSWLLAGNTGRLTGYRLSAPPPENRSC